MVNLIAVVIERQRSLNSAEKKISLNNRNYL